MAAAQHETKFFMVYRCILNSTQLEKPESFAVLCTVSVDKIYKFQINANQTSFK